MIDVIVIAQFTWGADPVLLQWGSPDPSSQFAYPQKAVSTTQTALAVRSGTPGYWSDGEVKAELEARLAASGMAVSVIAPVLNG